MSSPYHYQPEQQTPSPNSSNKLIIILLSVFGGLALLALIACGGIYFLLMSATRQVAAAMDGMVAEQNLKQIGLALHNYESAYKRFPAPSAVNANNEAVWSWRVSVLPFLPDENGANVNLYQQHVQINGIEMLPWDSPKNTVLNGPAPALFQTPMSDVPEDHAQVFFITARSDGELAPLFVDGKYRRFSEVIDGTSNTIMAIQFREFSRPWAAPNIMTADEAFQVMQAEPEPCNVLMADGSVFPLAKDVSRETFDAMVSCAGREIVQIPVASTENEGN